MLVVMSQELQVVPRDPPTTREIKPREGAKHETLFGGYKKNYVTDFTCKILHILLLKTPKNFFENSTPKNP